MLGVLVFCGSFATVHSQVQHRLNISSNKRFFVDEKQQPFFWLGDTGWLLFGRLSREEAEHYLEDRRKKGFNVIQVMLLHTLSVVNYYGDSALRNRNVSTPVTTPGNSFKDAAQYDFWDHVDHVIKLAAQKGLYMALVPVWGTNVKSGWVLQSDAEQYAKFLANRYVNQWNIIWLNGGDIRGTDSINTWRKIGTTIRSIDKNHLMTFHPFGRSTSSTWFHNEPWLDFNMFQSGHKSYEQDTISTEHRFGPDNYKFVELDYSRRPIKPTLDGEPSYEHIPYGLHDTSQPRWTQNDTRRYAYWEVFAGGAGYTFGHSSVMQMYRTGDPDASYGPHKTWDAALNDPGATQMIHLKQLMLSKPYFQGRSDSQLLNGKQGVRHDYIAATRGPSYAFLYTYNGRNFSVNMDRLGFENAKASWFNPRTGQRQFLQTFTSSSVTKFDPPGEKQDGNDWVLILEKA